MDIFEAAKKGDIVSVKNLIESGTPIDSQNASGHTALMYATALGHIKLVEFLAEKGANLSLKNKFGFTAIKLARIKKHTQVIEVLKNEQTIRELEDCTRSELFQKLRRKIEKEPREIKSVKKAVLNATERIMQRKDIHNAYKIYRFLIYFKKEATEYKNLIMIKNLELRIRDADGFLQVASKLGQFDSTKIVEKYLYRKHPELRDKGKKGFFETHPNIDVNFFRRMPPKESLAEKKYHFSTREMQRRCAYGI